MYSETLIVFIKENLILLKSVYVVIRGRSGVTDGSQPLSYPTPNNFSFDLITS